MKFKKELILLLTAIMIAMGSLVYAQDSNVASNAEPEDVEAGTEQLHQQIQVKGVVEKTDNEVTLFDGTKSYLLKGIVDFDPFAGKAVTVVGDDYSTDTGMEILVRQIAELE